MNDLPDAFSPSPTRPRAPVYQILARQVRALDVTVAFGLMSDDTAMFIAALEEEGVEFISARHENNAVAMADGYSAASGKLGLAVIGRGPATANCLHATVAASRTGSKILLIAGDAPIKPSSPLGPDDKAMNGPAVFAAAGLNVVHVPSSDVAQQSLIHAVRLANAGQLAALLLPLDVFRAEAGADEYAIDPSGVSAQLPAMTPRGAAIAAASALLAVSRRPIIVAGAGAFKAGAGPTLEALAEKVGALLITSAKGKDLFRDSPYNLGLLGSFSHSAARRLVERADCVLVFGAGLNRRTTSGGEALPADVPIVHIDCDRSRIGKWFNADIRIQADAKQAAEELLEAAQTPADKPFHAAEILKDLADFRPEQDFVMADTSHTMDPRSLMMELDRLLPFQRNVVYDSGNFLGVLPLLAMPDAGSIKLTSDFASVGLGLGTAIGVAAAQSEKLTVLVIGDGGLLMTLGELETAARMGQRIVVLVLNDCAYGAEMHFLKLNDLASNGVTFPDVDFAPIAEAFGFETATIRRQADIENLATMLEAPEGPVLIDCKINRAIAAPFLGEAALAAGARR
jgi:acetolactate synthase-1/2/3 large subunit